ncbi:MAG TPA: hypothetical protein VGH28_27435 [Polyangiaceae bacterium]
MTRRAIVLALFVSACRVECGPQPVAPQSRGRSDREPPPDVDREREQAQWNQAYGGSSNTPNISGGVVAGIAAAGVITGAGVAVALHDGGAAPQPADEHR